MAVTLLQLPLELILLLSEFLTPIDLIMLSQTCHSLRTIAQKYRKATCHSREESFAYLTVIAKERPQEWACEYCMALHPILELDTPTNIYSQLTLCLSRGEYSGLRKDYRAGHIYLGHRHVQLALKHARLRLPRYENYLEGLLKPHLELWAPLALHSAVSAVSSSHHAVYTAYPKIVRDIYGNLRFLLLSTRQYPRGLGDLYFYSKRERICSHLSFEHSLRRNKGLLPLVRKVQLEGVEKGVASTTSSCHDCALDLLVVYHSGDIHLIVWQDFGTEGTTGVIDWETRCLACGYGEHYKSLRPGHPIHHEPGAIRKFYGSTPVGVIPTWE